MSRREGARKVLRNLSVAVGVLCALGVTLPAGAQDTPASYEVAPSYDGIETRSLYVPSADGTRLAVRVHRPTRNGVVAAEPLPVIVQQFAGDPDPRFDPTIRYFTDRGYIWVAQSRRGTGASFGRQTGFITAFDAADAKAVIEWAGGQPFSNGRVGGFGCSNQGAWQYSVAALNPRYLVAITPQCASPQVFDDGITINGISFIGFATTPYDGECPDPAQTLRARPSSSAMRVDEDTDGSLLAAAIEEQKCGADFLGQYWLNMPRDGLNAFSGTRPGIDDSALNAWRAVRNSGVAILQQGGWFDSGVHGQVEGQRIWGGQLYLYPRTHGNRIDPARPYPNDVLDPNEPVLRWFDHYLKGTDNGAAVAGVTYYTINAPPGQEWRNVPSWPPAGIIPQVRYLSAAGLSADKPDAGVAPLVYAQQDVPLFDGRYAPLARDWEGDMAPADAKSLVFDMALDQDIEVTGAPVARLWASADAADVNVFAVLEDVAPDGRSTYVTDGALRASWRDVHTPPWGETKRVWHRGYAQDIRPLVPEEPVELVFSFFPTSYVFKAGHRLRVSIATSRGNTFQDPPLAEGKRPTLTLYRDAAHPSSIELPVMGTEN